MELMSRLLLGFKTGLIRETESHKEPRHSFPFLFLLGDRTCVSLSLQTTLPCFSILVGEMGCFHCSSLYITIPSTRREELAISQLQFQMLKNKVYLVQLKSGVHCWSVQLRLRMGSFLSVLRERTHENAFQSEQYDFQAMVPLGIQAQGIQKTTSEVFDLNERVSVFSTSSFMET